MNLEIFLQKIKQNEAIGFDETMTVIAEHYCYTPTEFSNGLRDDRIVNAAGVNEGSCKIFAFARLHQLNCEQTLHLFGDYYRQDVLRNPAGSGHANIRTFMKYGWDGIAFSGQALVAR